MRDFFLFWAPGPFGPHADDVFAGVFGGLLYDEAVDGVDGCCFDVEGWMLDADVLATAGVV